MNNAYLAVDFFFLLSGFVIAHAYDRRLRSDLTVTAFLRARLIRLWPLFALGCALGSIAYLAHGGTGGLATRVVYILPNFAMLPAAPAASPSSYLFPVDIPAWSLFFEIAANILFALLARHLRTRRLAVLVAAMAAVVIAAAFARGNLGGGDTWDSLANGLARVGFSFFAGVLLFRVLRPMARREEASQTGLSLLLGAILIAVFQFRAPVSWRWVYDLTFVLAVSPLVVALGARLSVSPWFERRYLQFGLVSYALYVLHEPLASYVTAVARSFGSVTSIDDPVLLALKIIIVVPVSCAAAYLYDAPVRRWLSGQRRGAVVETNIGR